jgi:pimeloyl-ACP methyl ester carboxylesterase
MVCELEQRVSSGGLEPPFILVGASFGGHICRLLASRRQADIKGIVLLDARHEALDIRMPTAWKKIEGSLASMQKAMLLLSKIRLLPLLGRIAGQRALPPAVNKLPLSMREMYLAIGYQQKYFETNLAEFESIAESDKQVANVSRLGDIPLMVIRHGNPEMFSALGPDDAAESESTWQELQNDLASLSDRSTLVVAESSGHMIQLDQPELVVDAIQQFVSNSNINRTKT